METWKGIGISAFAFRTTKRFGDEYTERLGFE